jgi:transketolase
MRNAFADEITRLGDADPRLVMLSADIGNRLFDKFKAKHPTRFYNCGVAEANMISLAAGLASCGLRPVCYTITPFITARCFEQIRVDVCYHRMPVIIVGTGSGLSYAGLGATHQSLEDIALLRSLPGMRVLAPADSMELRSCLRTAFGSNGPTYLRIGKKGEPVLCAEPPAFAFGTWRRVREGAEVTLLSTGNMLPTALATADLLTGHGLKPSLYSCASVKPLDSATLTRVFAESETVVTLEEHGLIGGFGSAVAEWLADQELPAKARLLRFGTGDHFLHEPGEQEHARQAYGLTPEAVARAVQATLTPAY